MNLIIMRHGQSGWSAPSDAERFLSDEGKAEVKDVAQKVSAWGQVSSVIASPYLRAQQTGILVADIIGCAIDTADVLVPEGKLQEGVSHVSMLLEHEDCLLLASHMPLVSKLTGWLCEGVINEGPIFDTANAAILELDSMGAGTARLVKMVLP